MTEFLRASVSRAAELRRSERTRFSVRARRRSRRVQSAMREQKRSKTWAGIIRRSPGAELERRMSGRPMPDNSADNPEGDSAPGYSHKRPPYVA